VTSLEAAALAALKAHFRLCDAGAPDPFRDGRRDPDGTLAWHAHRDAITASFARMARCARELIASEESSPAR